MRQYGEPSLIKVGSVLKKDRKRAYKKAGNEWVAVTCTSCGCETYTQHAKLYKFHKKFHKDGTWLCQICGTKKREADKKELNHALINLARNKGLI
tara:strand:- start:918 stop:1202 length:285 start_codon:yes stop_codon:yes gene_type:complete